mmetsp:Transcript_23123/g.58997  ORF Transcript_23123/g.58997 Transcript_23123/m.58997 type:complete len:102 (-) Transcript_23123:922-1227(-)
MGTMPPVDFARSVISPPGASGKRQTPGQTQKGKMMLDDEMKSDLIFDAYWMQLGQASANGREQRRRLAVGARNAVSGVPMHDRMNTTVLSDFPNHHSSQPK